MTQHEQAAAMARAAQIQAALGTVYGFDVAAHALMGIHELICQRVELHQGTGRVCRTVDPVAVADAMMAPLLGECCEVRRAS